MLQRSPTYSSVRGRNAIRPSRTTCASCEVDETWIHEIVRKQILYEQAAFTERTFTEPEKVKPENCSPTCGATWGPTTTSTPISHRATARGASASRSSRKQISSGDRRRQGVGGDGRDRPLHQEAGVLLKSGRVLEADLIVAATGFNMNALGDIAFEIDDEPLDFHETVTYRGMMFTGLPNLAWVFGYFRASWTLRADLVADFVCRLLKHMKADRRPARRGGAPPRGRGHGDPRLDGPGKLQPRTI